MSANHTDSLALLRQGVIALQSDLVEQRERATSIERSQESGTHALILGIVEVLDVVEQLIKQGDPGYLPKIAKLLLNLLKRQGVRRCEFPDGKVIPGLVRVLETRVGTGDPDGKILEYCRHGYRLGERVIRPADVITSGS